MMFELRNAAQTFQRFIDEVLRGLDFCFAYVDDILIFSTSVEKHIKHPRVVFGRLSDYGVIIKPTKCVYGQPELKLLGYIISAQGTKPMTDKVEVIKNFTQPTNFRSKTRESENPRSGHQLVNYLRHFTSNAPPICHLTILEISI